MTETEQLLYNKYGTLTMSLEQIGREIKRSRVAIRNAISAERFPIPTYKEGKLRLADIRDVAAYLDKKRQDGQEQREQEKAA